MSTARRKRTDDTRSRPNEKDAFDNFWEFVRKAEMDILENGHQGCPQPNSVGEPWDQDFADAHKVVEHFLKKYQGEHVAFPPIGMTWRSRPHYTSTAHQGLMEFLNPTVEVYGYAGLTESKEYLAIKKAAELELQARLLDKAGKDADGQEHKKTELISKIKFYHDSRGVGQSTKLLTMKQMVAIFSVDGKPKEGWSWSSIRRLLKEIFPGKGIKGYHELFGSDVDRSGHTDELEDGSHVHDGVINTNATYRANKCKK